MEGKVVMRCQEQLIACTVHEGTAEHYQNWVGFALIDHVILANVILQN